MSKLIPGTFLYKIVNGENTEVPERKPFYVQNADDYVRLLKRITNTMVSHLNTLMYKKCPRTKK